MEFRDYLLRYKLIYNKYLDIRKELEFRIFSLKRDLEKIRDNNVDFKTFEAVNKRYTEAYHRLYENYQQKIKALDDVWNETPAIIVYTSDLYEEVANYLTQTTKKPFRAECHTYYENNELKMYYSINLEDREIFRSDSHLVNEQNSIHQTTLFDLDNFYPSKKDVKSLKIFLYDYDYKDVFKYRLSKMSEEEQDDCIYNLKLFNRRRNEYLQSVLKDITFEELNEFIITIAENCAPELYQYSYEDAERGDRQ